MIRPYGFSTWYSHLIANSLQKDLNEIVRTGQSSHYASGLKIRGNVFWQMVYEQGVSPDVDSILAWADGRDDPFSSLESIAA